jgi:hypothetical protein
MGPRESGEAVNNGSGEDCPVSRCLVVVAGIDLGDITYQSRGPYSCHPRRIWGIGWGDSYPYMSSVAEEESRSVRGIVVAGSFADRVVLAAKAVPNLALQVYTYRFSFSKLE